MSLCGGDVSPLDLIFSSLVFFLLYTVLFVVFLL